MTLLQKILLAFLPVGKRAEAEAESRRWQMTCAACGHARSVWDLGGLRWKAAGNPAAIRKCPACGTTGKHMLQKRSAN